MSSIIKQVLKLIFGLGLLVLLCAQLDLDNIWDVLRNVRAEHLLYGLLFFVAATVFEVLKLHSLLHRTCGILVTVRIMFIGLFFNNFLPSSIGGDAYRVYMLKRYHCNLGAAVMPILLDRLTGLMILTISALIYSILNFSTLKLIVENNDFFLNSVFNTSMIFVLIGFFVCAAIMVKWKSIWVVKLLHRITALLLQAREAMLMITISDRMYLVLFSSMFHLCRLFGVFYFVLSFNEHIEWSAILLVLAVVAIISVLPVSIGALGVRESAFALMLSFFGVEFAIAVAVAFLVLFVLWSKSLIGGALYVVSRS